MYKSASFRYRWAAEGAMNDVLKTIAQRRSVRRFTAEQLRREDVEAIVEAGLCAPSANNAQDCHFTVVQDSGMIARIESWVLEEIGRSGSTALQELVRRDGSSIFRKAPTLIVVSTDTRSGNGIVDAAAATQNMLIAAESLGIASCWIGMVSVLSGSTVVADHARELHLPEGYSAHFGITLGYRESSRPLAPERRKDRVSFLGAGPDS